MKYLKPIIILFFLFNLMCCKKWDKSQGEMEDIRTYQNLGVDGFYYLNKNTEDISILPLIKPYCLMRIVDGVWSLDTESLENELGGIIDPTQYFGVQNIYIYGYKPYKKGNSGPEFDVPEKWFVINTEKHTLTYFDTKDTFKAELMKLELTEEFLGPDEIYQSFKENPILPWFPEEIKKQMKEAKKKIE